MRVRTLSLSRTLMMWPSGLSSCERPEALVLGTSLRAWVRTPPSSLEFNSAHLYPWPSWSKALDLSPNLFGGVGSNPTGCIWTDWRNGSASDSSPEGYVFESRIGHSSTEPRWSGGWTSVPQPFRDGAVRFRLGCVTHTIVERRHESSWSPARPRRATAARSRGARATTPSS